jgi:transposase InsO family protein
MTGKRTWQAEGAGWEFVPVCVDDAHLRTRPYRPQTNGKAERFIRTMLGGWAYGAIYRDSAQRTAALSGWLDFYNWRRPHGSLAHRPSGARLAELNNVAGSYI